MRILDELGDELVRAARADEAREARAPGRARRPRPRPRLSGARRPLPRAVVVGVASAVLLAAVAVAATLVIGRGAPIPAAPPGAVPRELQPVPGTARLSGLDVADPDGGPAWDVRTSRSRTGAICATVGQVLDGQLGIVGLDHDFHALPAGAADTCAITLGGDDAIIAGARAFRGGDGLTALTVVSGVVAPGVRGATATAGGATTTLRLASTGAFLAVFRGLPQDLRPRVTLTTSTGAHRTLRFADTGEYLADDPSGGAPWTLKRTTYATRHGLRCIAVQRERGPDSPQPIPRGIMLPRFQTASPPPRCAPDGTAFAAVQRFVPSARQSVLNSYWGPNPARTIAWGAVARPGAVVTVSAPGLAARRVAVDATSLGYAVILDGHVDPGAVRITVDGRAMAPFAGVTNHGGHAIARPATPPWRSVASALADAPRVSDLERPGRDVAIVARAADPAGGPAWALRTWRSVLTRAARAPKVDHDLRCVQAGIERDGRLVLPLAGGRTETLLPRGPDASLGGGCIDTRWLSTHAATPTVRTTLADPTAPAPRATRVVVSGLVGPGVRSAQLLGASARPQPLTLHRDGTYLTVLPARLAGRSLRVRIVRSDGRAQTSPPSDTHAGGGQCRFDLAKGMKVADPDGAAPWAAVASRSGSLVCRTLDQVVGGRLATIDAVEGTVRYGTGWLSSHTADLPGRGPLTVEVDGPGNEFLLGGPDATAPSAASNVRRTLPGRTLVTGEVAPEVTSITLRTPRDIRTIRPVGGTFLAVYDGAFYSGEIVATAHIKNAMDVTVRTPAAFLAPVG
ncbi:MAG TPA: hypothetical protein VFG42_03120 [Baekduia sp.]|uniref:hypothetical protein n=1 Tax=Baekduia sp. TaxID=2600305 RepID=UPI002D782BAD|nr:hypothetical protein [Baekduia sp.]HET6505759.1 hypothetical protein [Baekduia sp.]